MIDITCSPSYLVRLIGLWRGWVGPPDRTLAIGRRGRVTGIKQFIGRQVRECTIEVIPGGDYR